MPVPALPALGVIVTYLSRFLFTFIGLKALLITLSVTVLPIILNNLFFDILSQLQGAANDAASTASGSVSVAVVQVSGVASWIALKLRLPEVVSILLSSAAVKFSLRFSLLRLVF